MTRDNQIMWTFGDIDKTKQEMTLDFITALYKLGHEIWGKDQAIGTVRLQYPTPHPTHAREILVIDLHREFNIVISDPLVTTRLISRINIEDGQSQDFDDLRSILAGSASVTYSEFFSEGNLLEPSIVDEIFQEAVRAVTFNTQVTVGNGECSFSALTVEELLFFHAVLKRLFEAYSQFSRITKTRPWGVVHSSTGADVYLEHDPPIDGALISAFSSATAAYCNILFSAFPSRLVFGYNAFSGMDFITTPNNIFVVDNPQRLLGLQKFVRKWKKIPKQIRLDLIPAMKAYFIDLAALENRQRLKALDFHQVINNLTHMGIRRARDYKES
jgi:hypothetical protein